MEQRNSHKIERKPEHLQKIKIHSSHEVRQNWTIESVFLCGSRKNIQQACRFVVYFECNICILYGSLQNDTICVVISETT